MNGYQVHWSDGQNWNPGTAKQRHANLEWNYEHQHSKHSGMNFAFQKRTESIDWRKIAAADIDVITRTMDFNAIQDNIVNVAFCDIERELLLQQVDPTYIKVFLLAQLTIEYLLHSQEFLLSQLQESQLLLNQSNEELQKFKPEVDELHKELNDVKKESHKRKKIIATQQMIMKIGKDSYNKCPFCEKAFMNQSFLTAHIKNRHSKDTEAITAVSANTTAKAPLATSADNKENVGQLANGRRLEKEVKTLKEQLLQLERLLAEERQTRNAMTLTKSDRRNREEMEAWRENQHRNFEEELNRQKETFLRELNELHEKKRSADEALVALQKRKGQGMPAVSELESAELRRQREETAQLREELIIQKIDVIKLKERLEAKLKAVDGKPKSKRRRNDGKIRDGDPVEKKGAVQSLGHQPSPEQQQQPSRPDDDDTVFSDGDDDDDDEDDLLLTEASNFEESLALSQRTFPTIESMTLSLTETGRNSYRQKLDKNSTLVKGFRKEAEQELEARLEKWGINPRMHQINSSTLESVIRSMKTERTLKAKSFRNYYDVRNQYVTMVNQLSKEHLAEQRMKSQQLQQQSQRRKQTSSAGQASSAVGPAAPAKSSAQPVQGNMAATLSSTGQSFSEIGITYTSSGSSLFTAGSLSVKDLESDDDLLKQQPARIASAVVDRSKQPPASFDHTKKKQAGTSQPAKRETMPVAKSGKAEPNRNDDSDWDEISELPVDVNQANPGSSSSAAHAAGSTLQGSRTRPKPSPRARNMEIGSTSSLDEAPSPRSFATTENPQRQTLPRGIMHSTLEPSFTSSLNKGKKLRNSVTFSDDLETTEEALSVRDL